MRKIINVVLAVDKAYDQMRRSLKTMLSSLEGVEILLTQVVDGLSAWKQISGVGLAKNEERKQVDMLICSYNLSSLNALQLIKRFRGDQESKFLPVMVVIPELAQKDKKWVAALGEWGLVQVLVIPFPLALFSQKFFQLIRIISDPDEALFRQADNLHAEGKVERALSIIEKLLARDSSVPNLQLLNKRGELLAALGRREAAAEIFTGIIDQHSTFIAASKNYARLQQQSGNLPEAIRALQHVDSLIPVDGDRKIQIGELAFALNQPEEGKQYLLEALPLVDADSTKGKERVAGLLEEHGFKEEAAVVYAHLMEELAQKFMAQDPHEEISREALSAINRLAINLRKLGKYEDAERQYLLILDRMSSNMVIRYNLAVLYAYWSVKKGLPADDSNRKKAAAKSLLRKILDSNPEHREAANVLGKLGG